ncbi:MAG: lysylphosphatidylglycerol synthase transmembrane domain-containing protein [Acidimicrobiales bacterium]
MELRQTDQYQPRPKGPEKEPTGTSVGQASDSKPSRWRRLASGHPLRRAVLFVLVGLVVEFLVVPQIGGVQRSLGLLSRVNGGFIAAGVVLEIASLASYAKLTHAVLPHGRVRFLTLWRIDMATLALSHIVPGGTAGGDALGYRLLTEEEDLSGPEAGFALGSEGIGSALVLNAILWVALVVSIPVTGFNPLYGAAAAVGVVLFALATILVLLLTRGRERAATLLGRLASRVPFLQQATVDRVIKELSERILTMARDPRLLRRAVAWAAANWLLDALSLFVFLAAFGHIENPDGLLVAYGLAYVLAAIPVTPGGLGIVEAVLVPTLVGFGSPAGVALLGVVCYRLVNFWLPIPVGAFAYLSLKHPETSASKRRRRREELATLLEESRHATRAGAHTGTATPKGSAAE